MFVKKANYHPCLCFTFSLLVFRFIGGTFSLLSSKNSFRLAFQAFKPSFSDVVIFVLRVGFAKRPVKSRSLKRFLSGVFSPMASYVVARFSLVLFSKAAPKTANYVDIYPTVLYDAIPHYGLFDCMKYYRENGFENGRESIGNFLNSFSLSLVFVHSVRQR